MQKASLTGGLLHYGPSKKRSFVGDIGVKFDAYWDGVKSAIPLCTSH